MGTHDVDVAVAVGEDDHGEASQSLRDADVGEHGQAVARARQSHVEHYRVASTPTQGVERSIGRGSDLDGETFSHQTRRIEEGEPGIVFHQEDDASIVIYIATRSRRLLWTQRIMCIIEHGRQLRAGQRKNGSANQRKVRSAGRAGA